MLQKALTQDKLQYGILFLSPKGIGESIYFNFKHNILQPSIGFKIGQIFYNI